MTNDFVVKHYGVRGMRWGVRKKSGSRGSKDYRRSRKLLKKPLKDLSDDDLKKLNSRMQLERKARNLDNRVISKGKRFVAQVLVGAASAVATTLLIKGATKGPSYLAKKVLNN